MSPTAFSLRECTPEDAPSLSLVGGATFLEAFAGLVPGDAILWHAQRNHSAEAYQRYLSQEVARAWLAAIPPTFISMVPVPLPEVPAPVGYALVTAPDFEESLIQKNDLELRRIYAFSRFHGLGLGQALMTKALEYAREAKAGRLLLGVHHGNQRALAFYAKNGFRPIGSRTFQLDQVVYDDLVLACEFNTEQTA